jgi:hypothetical protein
VTLVVVRKIGRVLIAIADTKLSLEQGKKWSLEDQSNKLICLDQNWCFSYAGNTSYADDLLKNMWVIHEYTFKYLRDILLTANIRSIKNESEIDFLLFSSKSLEVFKIAHGKCLRQTGSQAWIGDHNAFALFQELTHLSDDTQHPLMTKWPGRPGGLDISAQIIDEMHNASHLRMSRAMEAIIKDGSNPQVGGFRITLVVADNICRFWPFVHAEARLVPSHSSISGDILFGEAETGDYSYDVITTPNAVDNFVSIHFPFLDKALVFRRWDGGLPYARVVPDVPSERAAEALEEMYNLIMWQVKVEKTTTGVYNVNPEMPSH